MRELSKKILRTRIDQANKVIIEAVANRMRLAEDMAEVKWKLHARWRSHKEGEPEEIVQPDREKVLLKEVRKLAAGEEISESFPDSIAALFTLVIGESCKVQMLNWQEKERKEKNGGANGEDKFRENLLVLTERWVHSYDSEYGGEKRPVVQACLDFEDEILEWVFSHLDEHGLNGLALDIGTATGQKTLSVRKRFEAVWGYDVSPHMITAANAKITGAGDRIKFEVKDVEEGIPALDESASFVILNLGTASDFRNTEKLLQEISRVLKRGGAAFLSFYNRDAILYSLEYLPWESALNARINLDKDFLEVGLPGGKTLSIFASAYSLGELEKILPRHLTLMRHFTFPTISAILPNDILKENKAKETIIAFDKSLAENGSNSGAYLMLVLEKT